MKRPTRTAAHEKALAKIRDLKALLKFQTAKYDRLRWHVSPVFGYDPTDGFTAASGMLKRNYDEDLSEATPRELGQ